MSDPRPPDRGGLRAAWWLVVLVVVAGATLMGWTIHALIRAAE